MNLLVFLVEWRMKLWVVWFGLFPLCGALGGARPINPHKKTNPTHNPFHLLYSFHFISWKAKEAQSPNQSHQSTNKIKLFNFLWLMVDWVALCSLRGKWNRSAQWASSSLFLAGCRGACRPHNQPKRQLTWPICFAHSFPWAAQLFTSLLFIKSFILKEWFGMKRKEVSERLLNSSFTYKDKWISFHN